MNTYWHGGKGGMASGQFVLPPSITKAPSTAKYGNYMCDTSKVYVTTDKAAAMMYAAFYPNGEYYEVEPVGTLQEDPDCKAEGLSYSCDKAKVLKRHKLSPTLRFAMIEALTA